MTLIEATATLGARLELLKRDFDLATANGAEDWQTRRAAFESVMAVIEFARSVPNMEGLDFGLVTIMEAISSVEKGATPSWLLNGSDGRPSVSDRVLVLRAKYAAVMEFLILNDDDKGRDKAAEYVWRKISSEMATALAGSRGTWRSVARWRDAFTNSTNAERQASQAEREAFESTLQMLATKITGKAEDRASKIIRLLDQFKP
jgi:hypothetical protein